MALSVKRKADRKLMADTVAALFRDNSTVPVEVTIEARGARELVVGVRYERGICVGIDFDGDTPFLPPTWVNPWHMHSKTDARFSEYFGVVAGGSINPHHFSKCTAVVYGWDSLRSNLANVIKLINSGEAYDGGREAAKIAKDGTWQERRDRWAAYAATIPA